jgi:hypothetical protein
MRTAIDCKHRAEECRKLAKLGGGPEDWAHFLEMAQTWELLAKQRQQENRLAETVALAEIIANSRGLKFESGPVPRHKKAA